MKVIDAVLDHLLAQLPSERGVLRGRRYSLRRAQGRRVRVVDADDR